jgi:G3E family GTPase
MTPILLVTGFLGAGKTTVVNHLLANAGGLRIAAVVNDFGAINIDAALIENATEGVISLANGCICCTLEGDLLRTLATLLRRTPRPEAIIIETSGIADPADIVRNLMDPVIFKAAPLETILCVIDAASPLAALDDPLLRAQIAAADVVALTKQDLTDAPSATRIRATIASRRPTALVIDAPNGHIPLPLLFPEHPDRTPLPRTPGRRRPISERFESLSWTSDHRLSLPRLQQAITSLAPKLARAKGLFESAEHPGRRLLFQLAGGRATLAPSGPQPAGAPSAQIVLIAEIGALAWPEITAALESCTVKDS